MKNMIIKVFLVLALVLVVSCSQNKKDTISQKKVKIYKIDNLAKNSTVSFVGQVIPHKESILAFKVAGPIKNIIVREGTIVKKDETLAVMDVRDYSVNIEAIKNKHLAAQAQAKNALAQFSRINTMYKANATPKKVYDEVSAQKNMAVAQEKMAFQEYQDAKNKLADTSLKAPYDGIITKKFVEDGTVVNAGSPVLSMMSNEDLEVSISASLQDINELKNSKDIKFVFDKKEYILQIIDISQKASMTGAAYPVRLGFKDKIDLTPGINGKVIISKSNDTDEVIIPLSAIFNDGKEDKVWIYNGEKVISRVVKLKGIDDQGNAIISQGLKIDDSIVEAGVDSLAEGENVGVIPEFSDTNVGRIM